jgi:hypothetical protein
VWNEAARRLAAARTVYLFGYSLPAGDVSTQMLLATRLRGKRVVVANVDGRIVEHLRERIGVEVDEKWMSGDSPIAEAARNYCMQH